MEKFYRKPSTALIVILLMLTFNMHISYSQIWQNLTIGREDWATNATLYVSSDSNIYRSTDGADTWTRRNSIGGTPFTITCNSNDPTCLLVGTEYNFFKSTDGGSNWSNIYTNDPVLHPLSSAISVSNPNYMFLGIKKVRGHESMRRTSTGSLKWNMVPYFFADVQSDIKAIAPHPFDSLDVWVGGSTPEDYYSASYTNGVFYSSDGGVNWSRTGELSKNVIALTAYMRDSINYLYAATDSIDYLYKTTNPRSDSADWTLVNFLGGLISDLKVDKNNNLYVATVNGLYKTTDDGVTWAQLNIGSNDIQCVAIDPVDPNIVFAISSTTIFKSADSGINWMSVSITGVTNPMSATTLKYKLYHNYPNPFNPITQIQYSLPENVFVTLKVFDMLGREVATLVNEYQAAGYKSVEFDAKDLPSGIYIYKISAGKFISAKKMILIR
jgi:hypothetical protein